MLCVGLVFAEICLPDDNTYYNPQLGMCAKCDSCLRGLGKDTVKVSYLLMVLSSGATSSSEK